MLTASRTLLFLLACVCAYSQAEFDAASVRAAHGADGRGMTVGCSGGPGTQDPGTISCENVTLTMLVTRAYNVTTRELAAPDWLSDARFDINAKVAPGTTREQLAQMWQHLLTDRFKLQAHREMRETPKYDLVVGKDGARLKPAAEESGEQPPRPRGPQKVDSDGFPELARPGMIGMDGHITLYDPKMTLELLARTIAEQLRRPVSDNTGLKGQYEVRLRWVDGQQNGPTLAMAVQDQLGLRLESKKGPVEFLVIDHVERIPTEN